MPRETHFYILIVYSTIVTIARYLTNVLLFAQFLNKNILINYYLYKLNLQFKANPSIMIKEFSVKVAAINI